MLDKAQAMNAHSAALIRVHVIDLLVHVVKGPPNDEATHFARARADFIAAEGHKPNQW